MSVFQAGGHFHRTVPIQTGFCPSLLKRSRAGSTLHNALVDAERRPFVDSRQAGDAQMAEKFLCDLRSGSTRLADQDICTDVIRSSPRKAHIRPKIHTHEKLAKLSRRTGITVVLLLIRRRHPSQPRARPRQLAIDDTEVLEESKFKPPGTLGYPDFAS